MAPKSVLIRTDYQIYSHIIPLLAFPETMHFVTHPFFSKFHMLLRIFQRFYSSVATCIYDSFSRSNFALLNHFSYTTSLSRQDNNRRSTYITRHAHIMHMAAAHTHIGKPWFRSLQLTQFQLQSAVGAWKLHILSSIQLGDVTPKSNQAAGQPGKRRGHLYALRAGDRDVWKKG